jgi:hypothetical protein
VSKNTKNNHAHICAGIYEGEFQLGFDCAGVETCKFALCHVMPPDGSEECTYNQCACRNPHSQIAALEALKNAINKELKKLDEENEW